MVSIVISLVFIMQICPVRPQIKKFLGPEGENGEFRLLLEEVMVKTLLPYKCVAVITDDIYKPIFEKTWFKKFGLFMSFIMVNVAESEDLLAPSNETQSCLVTAKHEGCQLYIILISNGLQVSRLLRYGDRYRDINTRAKFILLFDNRLFDKELFYLWKRIINVIFVRQYAKNANTGSKNTEWFEISTVPFPSPIASVFIPRRLDIWAKSRFRKNADLFRDKTFDLRRQTLKVAAFAHIPGTTKSPSLPRDSVRAILGNGSSSFVGTEIEILQTVSNAMNFKCDIYQPSNADVELWGGKKSGKYTGLIGEMVNTRADIALGDLYYMPYILELMDLSVPYNTECLTFLTPEALTDNSWKTLILPFKPTMWAAVLICLAVCMVVFHYLAKFHQNITKTQEIEKKKETKLLFKKTKKIVTLSLYPEFEKLDPDVKYAKMKGQYVLPRKEDEPMGLYQFSEPINSILYTYSMLLLVSLPKLPTGWSLRMLTGWYWLYCLLLVVAYRASMTAILARPTPRVTIDTLQELLDSRLACGGWGEINRDFFRTSLDPSVRSIGENFEMVTDSGEAVDRVAQGLFAFYENSYFLKGALVNRQLRFQALRSNSNASNDTSQSKEARDIAREDRNLHVMTDCVIKMPISIGLQKNSPIKPRVDKIIRRVLEAGLIKKWLDDVMARILNAEVHDFSYETKAIMSMKKFFGALVALLIGYLISVLALIVELSYFHLCIKKKPHYNNFSKISRKIFRYVKKEE